MEWISLIVGVMSAQLVGISSGLFTVKAIPTWYAGLKKPTWNPPNRVFAPVWTLLYLMMGVAAGLVYERVGWRSELWIYSSQLALNWLWSVLFFGARRPDWAFFEVVLLWVSIVACMIAFWPVSVLAAALLLPYLAWVSFASCLNAAIWRLNP